MEISTKVKNKFYSLMEKKYFKLVSVTENDETSVSAECQLCKLSNKTKLISYDGSISNCTKHLKAIHRDAHDDHTKNAQNNKRIRLDVGLDQTTLSHFSQGKTLASKTKIDKLTVQYIVNGMMPLSTVENKDFRKFVHGLIEDSSVPVMSVKTLKLKIKEYYDDTKRSIIEKLNNINHLCLTADIWTAHAKSYLGVTCHWINEKYERVSAALSCKRFLGVHSYDRVAEELMKVMQDFKLQDKTIECVVTDNGSNFVKCFKEFAKPYGDEFEEDDDDCVNVNPDCETEAENSDHETDDEQEEGDVIHYVPIVENADNSSDQVKLPPHFRCVAHTLNLVGSKDVINEVKDKPSRALYHKVMGKCSKLWRLSSNSKSAEIMERICRKRLSCPGQTRWNSYYDAICLILSVETKLENLFLELKIPYFSTKEMLFLKEYKLVFEPLATSLDKLQGEKKIFMGNCLPTIYRANVILKELEGKLKVAEHFRLAAIASISKRFDWLLNIDYKSPSLFLYATLCHPYFKFRWLQCSNDEILFLKEAFIKKCHEFGKKAVADILENEILPENDDFFKFSSASQSQELGNVVSYENIEIECNNFFRDKKIEVDSLAKYPSIDKMFRKFNTALPSSAPVEREFSYAGLIMNKKRSRLGDNIFNMLVVLKCNNVFQKR